MKQYLLIFITLLLISCDSLIDCPPKYQLVCGDNITDEASALSILNGGYAQLLKDGKSSFECHNYFDYRYYSTTAELLGLWSGKSSLNTDMDLRNFNYNNIYNESMNNNIFNQLLLKTCGIASNANTVIKYLPNLSEYKFSNNNKQYYLGEAYFLRAFAFLYYFRFSGYAHDINSEYGGVYWEDHPSANNLYVKRFTVRETYERLLADLSKAVEADIPFTTPFRASSILARLYKAEVLLMRGEPNDAQEALKLCNDIIASDERELEEKYSDIYDNKYQSKELMFTRFYSDDNLEFIKKPTSSNRYLYNSLGTKSDISTSDLYKNICKNDARSNSLIEVLKYENNSVTLFKNCYDSNDDNIPMYYARKAQAYIMKAEALMKCGADANQIYDALDVLRDRGGCEKINRIQGAKDDYLSDLIFKEAIKELNFESPYTWNLSIRLKYNNKSIIKKYRNKKMAHYPIEKVVFAISPMEIRVNRNIYQNPMFKHLN